MPMHDHRCEKCGREETVMFSVHEDAIWPRCCGENMPRTYHGNRRHTGVFDKPIQMHSVALCHPDDITEFKNRHPDIECSADPDHPLYGVPLARTRSEKKRVLEDAGFEERN